MDFEGLPSALYISIFISWVLALFEMISLHGFWPLIYSLGIPVYRTTLTLPGYITDRKPQNVIRMEEGKFRVYEDQVLFLSRYRIIDLRFSPPFPFKCTGTFLDSKTIDITARMTVGAPLVVLFFSLIFAGSGIKSYIETGEFYSFIFISMGVVLPVLLVLFSLAIGKARVNTMVFELTGILNKSLD